MALMLSSTLPNSADGCDGLVADADIEGTVQPCGPELFAVVHDVFGEHRLNLVAHTYFDREDAIIRRFERVGEMLGAEYLVRICDPWNQRPDEPMVCTAPIEIRLSMRADRCEMVFTASPEEPNDDDAWFENESGYVVCKKSGWYEEEYQFYRPDHWLIASTSVVSEAEKVLAMEYAVKRALSISPLVNQLGAIESLIAIERALMASDFVWEIEQYTWI